MLLLAFLVESLTEYFAGKLVENIPAIKQFAWLLPYVAGAVGIGGAFVYHFDLMVLVGSFMGNDLSLTPFGQVLTGLAIGRGANYIHDLWSRYFVKPSPVA